MTNTISMPSEGSMESSDSVDFILEVEDEANGLSKV